MKWRKFTHIHKKAREPLVTYPALRGLRIAHHCWISNANTHADMNIRTTPSGAVKSGNGIICTDIAYP